MARRVNRISSVSDHPSFATLLPNLATDVPGSGLCPQHKQCVDLLISTRNLACVPPDVCPAGAYYLWRFRSCSGIALSLQPTGDSTDSTPSTNVLEGCHEESGLRIDANGKYTPASDLKSQASTAAPLSGQQITATAADTDSQDDLDTPQRLSWQHYKQLAYRKAFEGAETAFLGKPTGRTYTSVTAIS